MSDTPVCLTLGSSRLQFTALSGGGFGYGLLLSKADGTWRRITANANPLVRGSSFDLYPTTAIQVSDKQILLRGTHGYAYSARITSDAQCNWFKFDIELDLPAAQNLSMVGGYEPEMMLDMGPLPPYERGDHVWFMTNISNPTKWNDDAFGNDMPATYLFDAYLRAEVLMFFDMTSMGWMSMHNTGRFLNYRCGYRRCYQPEPVGFLGLYLDGFSGATLPAGKVRFVYHISAAPREETPTDQEAVQLLVERCLPLLPKNSNWPSNATSWRDFARCCARDLMTDHVWHKADHGEYMLNYVDAHSPAWKQTLQARGFPFDMDKPCFESGVWGAHPLGILRQIEANPLYDQLHARMLAFIDRMVDAGLTPLAEAKKLARGTWQHVYIVEQMFQVARTESNTALLDRIRHEVDHVIIPFARKMKYFFPLSFDNLSLTKCGSGDAHSLLGTYASLMIDLNEWTGEQQYLDEAMTAVRVHYRLPVNTVHQEVFMLGMGVHAAARLLAKTGDDEFSVICQYLLAQTLRMLHWFDDRTTSEQRQIHTLGMFLACGAINYSAIFENIETLARIAPALALLTPPEGLLRVFDHARKNNFYFFPRCLPDHDELPLKYVPLENIGILEGPPATTVGAEVYGAGWVFRAHLLWEALGHCTNREIMVLNCSSFDERRHLAQGKWAVDFIIYNPTDEQLRAELVFPVAMELNATIVDGETQSIKGGRYVTQLASGEYRRIKLLVP